MDPPAEELARPAAGICPAGSGVSLLAAAPLPTLCGACALTAFAAAVEEPWHVSCQTAPRLLPQCVNYKPSLQVYSLMNLGFAWHEIISDYITASILWFESRWVSAHEGGWGSGACAGLALHPPAAASVVTRRQHHPSF